MRLREIPFFAFWTIGVCTLGLVAGDGALKLFSGGWPPDGDDLLGVFAATVLTVAGVWWLIDWARGGDSSYHD
jgi:hypothetical protein